MSGHKITRDAISSGALEHHLIDAERRGLFTRLPEELRIASRERTLAAFRPDEEIWVFGYGSLIWNPAFHFVECRAARIYGRHRRFCLETPLGRGSPECPGLVLGLDLGGCCEGMAFRLERASAAEELDIVWRREMVSDAYRPVFVICHSAAGKFRAVTFAINRQSPRYCGQRSVEEVARSIARAEGWLGPCSDYLFNTVAHLEEFNLGDAYLRDLSRRVRELQAARP